LNESDKNGYIKHYLFILVL